MPHKSGHHLKNFEDISVAPVDKEKSESFARKRSTGKDHPIHNSTNVVTWALLEAIETTKGE